MRAARIAIVALAVALAACGGTWISPLDAYRLESKPCRAERDPEAARRCQSMVDKKYGRYNSEGGYPDSHTTPGPRGNTP